MIYPRTKVAKDLLTEDGVIFISIDDNEHENLKKICDEVFGTRNLWLSWFGKRRKKVLFKQKLYQHERVCVGVCKK